MLSGLKVVIISPNQLQAIGLKYLLTEYFNPTGIIITSQFDARQLPKADIIFLAASLYIAHEDHLYNLRKKIILITDTEYRISHSLPAISTIDNETDIIEHLERIFSSLLQAETQRNDQTLTTREIDVLKLVAKGYLNKQIADMLGISLHTVISHRKNITSKLGIKTVPGLTLYALMNGLISSTDIK